MSENSFWCSHHEDKIPKIKALTKCIPTKCKSFCQRKKRTRIYLWNAKKGKQHERDLLQTDDVYLPSSVT